MPNTKFSTHKERMRQALNSALSDGRVRLWLFLAMFFIVASGLTRIVLAGIAIASGQITFSNTPSVMVVGLLYDIVTALSLFAPFAIYLALVPERLYRRRWHHWLMGILCSLTVFGLMYLGAVEYFFFDEFNSRFNFVAVEYLIYPHEVFVNIWQSYPVAKVLLATALMTAALSWTVRDRIFGHGIKSVRPLRRLALLGVLALLIAAAQATVDFNTGRYSGN